MKGLRIFYLENCPYCRKAKTALTELKNENPDFERVGIEWIEESISPKIADSYDYYRVPCVYSGNEKLYECRPGDDFDEIKRQLEKALKYATEESLYTRSKP